MIDPDLLAHVADANETEPESWVDELRCLGVVEPEPDIEAPGDDPHSPYE